MKKIFNLLLIIAVLFLLSSCELKYYINDYESLNVEIESLEYSKEGKIYYYESKEEVDKLNFEYLAKYDENYFVENSLVIITIKDRELCDFSALSIGGVTITLERNLPTANLSNTDIFSNWTIIIEVLSRIYKIENYTLYIQNYFEGKSHSHNYNPVMVHETCYSDGYYLEECWCGYYYKYFYYPIRECHYDNGKCIWCGKIEEVS